MTIQLERRYRFSASHLYRRDEWSEEENRRRFGKCANLPGHGHNYRLFVRVQGAVDPQTGFLVDLPGLDRIVLERVVEVLDHQHINHAVAEFGPGGMIPSSESLLLWIRPRVEAGLLELDDTVRLVGLRLEEDEDLAAEWRPGE